MSQEFLGKVGFAVGTGRCGTKFIAKALELESQIASSHERNPLNETFHRYCKWYGIPIDHEGFLQTKAWEIQDDLKDCPFSFESSAFLSLSIQELYERFGAKFLLLVRSPEKVVNSYLQKGWYEKSIYRLDPDLPPSYQDCRLFHHFLGRIIPSGKEYTNWQAMSRVGKLAWYWNMLNTCVLEQFKQIPETHWRIERLEDMSYPCYREIVQFLGFESTVTAGAYDALSNNRPNAFAKVPAVTIWSDSEIFEFESAVAPLAEQLGYEYRVSNLKSLPAKPSATKSLSKRQTAPESDSMAKVSQTGQWRRKLTTNVINRIRRVTKFSL